MRPRTLKELAAEVRARCADPTIHPDKPLVDLWRRELDGMARSSILSMGIHGPDMAAKVAADALCAGVTPSVVADALDECERIYGDDPTP